VPEGFKLFNGTQQVVAKGPGNSNIVFSGAEVQAGTSMNAYLTNIWAKNANLSGVQNISVNGMEAATGSATVQNRSGTFNAQLVAIRHSANRVYRFMFLSPATQSAALSEDFRRTTFSFRKLNRADRQRYNAWLIDTRVVGRGDSVASLSRSMPLPGPKEEWFRVLNGLQPGSEPFPGQTVKVVVE
jgi:predicted Zn-dependent protease